MPPSDFFVPPESARAEIEVKKSRFIAEIFYAADASAAREQLKAQKTRYVDASHVVHAFITGAQGETRGMSDDGEPAGTSARPVMDVLAGKNYTNCLLTVARYFGGTLLGTGGLVKAYGDAAKAVIALCKSSPLVQKCRVSAQIPYESYERCARLFAQLGAEGVENVFETDVTITVELPQVHLEQLKKELADITSGRGVLQTLTTRQQ
jgi:uncharacterized YigZ family protein